MDANNLSEIDRGKTYLLRVDNGLGTAGNVNGIGD